MIASSVTSLHIPQLDHTDQNLLDQCLNQLMRRSTRNRLRRKYYDHKNQLRDLGIAIPPALKSVETVVGWPAKSVDSLARRVILDGFTSSGTATADLGLDQLLEANWFQLESGQAHTSSFISSVAFIATTAGDTASGEPEVLITAGSAESATGLRDARRRSLKAAVNIFETDDTGRPSNLVLYVPNKAIILKRQSTGVWDVRQSAHDLGIPVDPLVYRPSLDRPFGRSRISRAVMALTDSAVRTLLRSEVSAEFFSAPQRYVLGADESQFVDKNGDPVPAWKSLIGRILAMSRDEEGEVPTVGQFSQQSMQPHFEQLRALAAMFAAESNLPLDALGIVQDNPSSAEAITRAKEELVLDAKQAISSFTPSWNRAVRRALTMVDGSSAAVAEYAKVNAKWVNPATPSVVSATDAVTKQVAVFPWMADSEVALEAMGYDQSQVQRLMSDKARAQARASAAGLFESPAQPEAVVGADGGSR